MNIKAVKLVPFLSATSKTINSALRYAEEKSVIALLFGQLIVELNFLYRSLFSYQNAMQKIFILFFYRTFYPFVSRTCARGLRLLCISVQNGLQG